MKGDAELLIKFFDGSDKRFIIPLYQRNYDWKEENCAQLFSDLKKLHESGRPSHFFGSIVSSIESGTEDRYIIDGQQRITTVSLLLIAMVNAYKAGSIEADDTKLVEKIFKRYLVDEYQEDQRKVKLKPIKKDMEAFDALLYKHPDAYIKESNVTRNYNFFYDKILGSGMTLDQLFNAIKRLVVINIKLDSQDDPQLIFESLNSTGLDLSEADKIRNYLLMSLSPSEQDNLYTRYWNPIEEDTAYEPSLFVRDYLTMKQGKIGRIDQIYFIFKEYAEFLTLTRAELLSDMHKYAKIYKQIECANVGNAKVNRILKQLKTLDSRVAYPFYLAFFAYVQETNLEIDQQVKVLNVIETFWARRVICNLPANALNKIFATLHRDVLSLMEKSADAQPKYAEVLIYIILNKKGSSSMPSDEDVKSDFSTRQVYKMPIPARSFLLERLENRDNDKRHDVVGQLSRKEATIEHIMPQTLSEEWKKNLGPEWERIHQQYLHTMANLTLTGYNSQYSNLSFKAKKTMEKGFLESAYRLDNFVKDCEEWTENEMRQRLSGLIEIVMRLWPLPHTDFVPAEVNADSASLDDEEYEFTGKKIMAYVFKGARFAVNTWKEMIIQVVVQILHEKRPTLVWLAANNQFGLRKTPQEGYTELAPDINLWTDTSTYSKMWVLRNIFNECGIPQSDLVFEFRSDNEE